MRSPSPPDDSGPAYDVVTVLRAERVRRVTHVAALQRSMGELVAASDNSNADDEHDPEGVRDGSYGICRVCGRPIATARLGARPSATACVTCALIRR